MKPDGRSKGLGSSVGSDRGTGRLRPPVSAPLDTPPISSQAIQNVALSSARKFSNAEFNTAMAHLYRGEVQRSNTWRNRLDTTTNWAVLTAGATLSFAFSSPTNPHFVIPINSILLVIFLLMEARRYRYYEVWSNRVRMMETGYFAQMLTPENGVSNQHWAEALASDLLTPHFTITEWEAVGRRLRRNYLWIFVLMALCWNLKVYLHPVPATDFAEFVERATIGVVPGWVLLAIGVVFNVAIFVFAIATVRLRQATGEVLPHHEFSLRSFGRVTGLSRVASSGRRAAASRRAVRARRRVRTTGSLASDSKRPERTNLDDITETPEEVGSTR
jgi:uncharacterized membrane protein